MTSVADCERVQTHWFTTRVAVLGGDAWQDGPLLWVDGPDGRLLLFPPELPAAPLARGIERAHGRGLERADGRRGAGVGVWLGAEVDPSPLAAAGFERGWEPWWMSARPVDVATATPDARIELQEQTSDYGGEHADYADELAVAADRPKHSWYAAAYAGRRRRFAGRGWSHLAGSHAGVFDLSIWPPFRRQGLASAVLRTVCAAAAEAGAEAFVLNATAEGRPLYEANGFALIGTGVTWWLSGDRHSS